MTFYGVKAIRLDAAQQRITHLLWVHLGSQRPLGYHATESSVLETVQTIKAGNHVHLLSEIAPGEYLFGPEFHVIAYPDETQGVDIDGYELTELRQF